MICFHLRFRTFPLEATCAVWTSPVPIRGIVDVAHAAARTASAVTRSEQVDGSVSIGRFAAAFPWAYRTPKSGRECETIGAERRRLDRARLCKPQPRPRDAASARRAGSVTSSVPVPRFSTPPELPFLADALTCAHSVSCPPLLRPLARLPLFGSRSAAPHASLRHHSESLCPCPSPGSAVSPSSVLHHTLLLFSS
ncbi:hypothetical protein AcW2_000088 [Taiwanofungus camphoratus]|nr:hypothetical protein AcW2_000088 [Antrodia cinnamomea]